MKIMSFVRCEYFLVISMAIVSHFHKSPRIIDLCKSTKEQTAMEKCYEGLGCVRLTKEWSHRRHRPTNLLPADRHAINTIFLHWTLRDGNATAEIIGGGVNALKVSGIAGSSDVRILIHDFTSNGYTGWIRHLAHALLTSAASQKLSVVSVDWAAGAEPPYVQAVANARLVALEIVHFLKELKNNFHIEPGHIHMIGHGVGAHTAGYVGKLVLGIRRITALDPSGPYFQHMSPNVKLHRRDAIYVEVVHTDCGWGGQGNKELTGHVDFYPNGGKQQPGCEREWTPFGITGVRRSELQLGEIYPGCSHKRAFKYYIESLTRPSCEFIGFACIKYADYLAGTCVRCGPKNENCALLSPFSEPSFNNNNSAEYYFATTADSPFCVETLHVIVGIIGNARVKCKDVSGYFNVTIPQSGGDVSFKLNENGYRSLRTGFRHTFLVLRATPPFTRTPVRQVKLTWHRERLPCMWGCRQLLVSNITLLKITGTNNGSQAFCGKSPEVVMKIAVPQVFGNCANN